MRKKRLAPLIIAILVGGSLFYTLSIPHSDGGGTPWTEVQAKASEVVWSNNQFALDLYPKLTAEGRNVFFSPWSISSTLAMAYEGAGGQTAKEMRSVLHLPKNDTVRREGYAAFFRYLNHVQGCVLETANALWHRKGDSFSENYLDLAREYYSAKIKQLNCSNPKKARNTINNWVANKTRGKIEKLLEKPIGGYIVMVLTNAIYFKGKWLKQFPKEATEKEKFWLTPDHSVEVPMMQMNDVFKFARTENLKAVELPYTGKDLSMMILLPERGNLKNVERSLSASKLQEIREDMQLKNVSVKMPKFTLHPRYGNGTLRTILKELGMPSAFGDANFSKMTELPVCIDDVVHEACVSVSEEGTEAAAGTGVPMPIGPSPHMNYITANHPFVFVIQENTTGNILFIGRVVNPSQGG